MGALQARVLGVLWDTDGWMTPGRVHERLRYDGEHLAYNTVMTVLVRLWRAGPLERRREGRAFAYRPVQSREEHAATRMAQLLEATGDRASALSHFLDVIGARERARLRRLLGR